MDRPRRVGLPWYEPDSYEALRAHLADGGKLPPVNAFALIKKGIKIGGSLIGAPGEIEEMLKVAVEKKVKPWVQKRPLKDANQAILDMDAGKARYRYVLVNENFGKHGV